MVEPDRIIGAEMVLGLLSSAPIDEILTPEFGGEGGEMITGSGMGPPMRSCIQSRFLEMNIILMAPST